uniref:Protein kinase domain-containing protein n=1 Tax=Chromera velia CCMP2878 TaxID=1169474 RepID=A0A0G4GSX7_9ALVE|eukprot:Cvel_23265.t1-p1 / transcript=Cvel_23265.t1 / gene=Cvel_23265 / organism=Chromera_velia_CCMP2878 / gene_product=hypothetical protein / transcript_product=hypothetical protein / location=Cvel_scaffold2378:19703-21537(+) / protein_length=415 / sequence_SO=supercontig / SO=protein_coding / is_pseudo=false
MSSLSSFRLQNTRRKLRKLVSAVKEARHCTKKATIERERLCKELNAGKLPELEANSVKVQEMYDAGAFGVVFSGIFRGGRVAIKVARAPQRGGALLKEGVLTARVGEGEGEMWVPQVYGVVFIPWGKLPWGKAGGIAEERERGEICSALVMEWVEGVALEKFFGRGAGSSEVALEVARQLFHFLHYLATLNIVHCDLQTKNVFVCPATAPGKGIQVKVIDFGEAVEADVEAGRKGHPSFQTPEMLARGMPISCPSDTFAVGLLLWWMLTRLPLWQEVVRRLEAERRREVGDENFALTLPQQHHAIAFEELRPPLDLLPQNDAALPPSSVDALRQVLRSCWKEEADRRVAPKDAAEKLAALQGSTPEDLEEALNSFIRSLSSREFSSEGSWDDDTGRSSEVAEQRGDDEDDSEFSW